MSQIVRPNIYAFLEYRLFVREMYSFLKSERKSLSVRVFSKMAGLKSSNFLKLVTDGKRNLSQESIFKFARALGLNKQETAYFEILVLFGQAKNVDEKNRYFERLSRFRNQADVKTLDVAQYVFFSKWYFVAIKELIDHPDFREDHFYVSDKLGIKLRQHEFEQAIQTIIDIGFAERDASGRLRSKESRLVTNPAVADMNLINFLREMIGKALNALEKIDPDKRDISSLTVSLTHEQFSEIKDRINSFRRELHALVTESKQSKAVYQINFQMFNLTGVPW